MAQYRLSVHKPISRGKGQSAIAKAAYNARDCIRDERTGQQKDFSRKKDKVLFSGIFVDPKRNAPAWVQDRPALWNAASAAEKRKDAREAQEIILNLPHELTAEQRRFMLTDFVREHITRGTGRIADVNMHAPSKSGDDRNIHAHILMTVREIGPDGFGKQRLEVSEEQIRHWKEKWAERGAKELRKAGFELEAERWRVGHLTLERQRQAALERGDLAHAETLDREPTKHLGPHVASMERKGIETERGNAYRDTVERNEARAENRRLKLELAEIQNAIAQHEREWADAVAKAAIEKEKIERRFVEPKPERGALAGGQPTRDHRPQEAPEHLQGTVAAIWLANHRSDNAKAFAAALNEKGIALAITTKEEAEQSRKQTEAAKAEGRTASAYRENEIVAVDDRARVYRLAERITGSDFRNMQAYLQKLDRSKLHGIVETRQMMHNERPTEGGRIFGRGGGAADDHLQKEVRDRAERMSMLMELASEPAELRKTVLDRVERRTIENERAQGPRNTRDS